MESRAAGQASSCLCAEEAKTFHWDIAAVRLGKRGLTGWGADRALALCVSLPRSLVSAFLLFFAST